MFTILFLIGSVTAQDDSSETIRVNCDEDDACTEVVVMEDPIEHGCLVVDGVAFSNPCAIRGQFDPGLWQDGETGTLWLTYTRASLFFPEENDFDVFAPRFDIHLARSDDNGATWQYVTTAAETTVYDHPDHGAGIIAHEVPDIVQNSDNSWSLVWLQYTRPYMVEAYSDPVVARKDASTPEALADAPLQFHLSGWGASQYFPPEHTPTSPLNLSHCVGMTEPSAFIAEGRSFVVVECLSVDITNPAFPLISEEWGMELFEWVNNEYRHIGTLLDYNDALALTAGDGDEISLAQPDVALSQSGELLLMVTPINFSQDPPHQGCRVLIIDDLDSATVQRDADDVPQVRTEITATSEHLGAGQCTYNAASETGVLFSVGFEEGEGIRLHLVASGVHP